MNHISFALGWLFGMFIHLPDLLLFLIRETIGVFAFWYRLLWFGIVWEWRKWRYRR